MNNNKLTQVEANLMIDDLVRIVSENPQEFNQNAVNMRSDCHQPEDIDFGKNNSAITYIWLR